MIDLTTSFIMFKNCIPVKGFKRSIICDLQRKNFDLIPTELYEILIKYEYYSVNEIKKIFNNQYDEIIEEYFEFLYLKEYIFFSKNVDNFPSLENKYYSPFVITNGVFDISNSSFLLKNFDILLKSINDVKCKHFEIRFMEDVALVDIIDILKKIKKNTSQYIQIGVYMKFISNNQIYFNIMNEFDFVNYLFIYSSDFDKSEIVNEDNKRMLLYFKKKFVDEKSCGVISPLYFNVNMKSFMESHNHNSCLNGKIAVDKDGCIKNCPSMLDSYGNIETTTFREAIENKNFKKYWNITKDVIEVCKDCEFRHICTDCRAYTERTHFDGEIDKSKPLKCGYSPYTNEWAEWSTNKLKKDAIDFYQLRSI